MNVTFPYEREHSSACPLHTEALSDKVTARTHSLDEARPLTHVETNQEQREAQAAPSEVKQTAPASCRGQQQVGVFPNTGASSPTEASWWEWQPKGVRDHFGSWALTCNGCAFAERSSNERMYVGHDARTHRAYRSFPLLAACTV